MRDFLFSRLHAVGRKCRSEEAKHADHKPASACGAVNLLFLATIRWFLAVCDYLKMLYSTSSQWDSPRLTGTYPTILSST